MMRLWIYLGMLASVGGVLGVSAAGGLRPQVQPAAKTWRAIGAMQPRLSPDGESIAFACQGALWRIPRDALYSQPDGKRLIANCRAANGYALSWVDLATGATKSVFTPPVEARVFALSPDGASVAYAVHQDVPGEQGGHNGPQADLWIAASEGGEAKKLVRFRSRIFDLAWGGATIFGVSDLGGAHNDLWEIPLKPDPEQSRRLTTGQADEDAPSVAGSWLLYTDNREGATALVTRDLATGDEKIVAVSGMDYGRPTGQLALEFVEKATGRPLIAR